MESGRRSVALKVLALCTALGLGGGYVWQRQHASKTAEEKAVLEEKRAMMPGSKSALIVEEGDQVSREEIDRTLIGSSKSGAVVLDDLNLVPVPTPGADDEKKAEERTILPGSKSFRIVPPQPPEEEP
jgi:hypothetical protein